ncbi:MFS transporter [Paenibacillus sp. GCM10012306]|uniref:MFS transporter n=1 Tax=Paenibacillus sp. GCM10012306 TaxID=3317342 RepID=UPI00362032DB
MNTHQDKLWTQSFITLTVSYLFLFLCLHMLLTPFPAYVKEQFHPGDFTLSLVTSLFALAAIASRFATAALLRKVTRNTLLLIGIVLAALTTLLYPYAASMSQLLVLRVVFGVGFGIASTILPTIVSQIIPQNRMGEGIGYFGLSTSIAMSVGPMVGLTVLHDYGFTSLSIMGTVFALALIPLLLTSRSLPAPTDRPVQADLSSEASAHAKRRVGKMLFPAVLNMLLSVSYGGLLGFLALYGQEKHLDQIGLFFLFIAGTVLVIRPISGRMFDRKGPAPVLIPAALVTIASMVILSVADSMLPVILSALLYGLGYGAIQSTTQAWVIREAAPEQHSLANSLYYNAIDLGVAAGSMLLGLVASAQGYSVMYRWSAGVMVLFLIVFVVQQWMGRSRRRQAPGRAS